MKRLREVSELQKTTRPFSSVRDYHTEGRATRNNVHNVIQIIVNQGNEGTCFFVTLAKVCLYNVIGLVMNITLTPEEKTQLDNFTRLVPLRTDTELTSRDLEKLNITPETCSPKGFALIVLFFYFYDWIKKNDMRGFYHSGPMINMKAVDRRPYDIKLVKLFDFLKLTTKRLGGIHFIASGWIDVITTSLAPLVEGITWKRVAVCTLNTKWSSDIPTFTPEEFQYFCDNIIFPMTTKLKIMLALKSADNNTLHEVMVVGIEHNRLLISNSWGSAIDITPIEMLPRIRLTHLGVTSDWLAFQFTFLLPMIVPIEFKSQYYSKDLRELVDTMTPYLQDITTRTFPTMDPVRIDELVKHERAKMLRTGGKRKSNRIRYGSQTRKNVSSSNYRKNSSK